MSATGALAAWRTIAPRPVIFAYHNVVPAGAIPRGESSLHLPADQFAAQMKWLTARFRVVPLSEMAAVITAGPTRERVAAITFDDAYRGTFLHAVPILQHFGLHATIFVVESASEAPRWFWWDAVATERPQLDRNALRSSWGGDGRAILQAAGVDAASIQLPEEYLPADWALIRQIRSASIEIGAHTRTHRMLTSLPPELLEDELRGARQDIGRRLGEMPESLAYPYGDWNDSVAAAAELAGYRRAVTTRRRWESSIRDPLRIPRQTISAGMTGAAFAAAASGLRLSR